MKEELKYQWLQLKLILTTLSTKKILSLLLLIKVTQNVCLLILINRKDAEVAVFQVLQLVKRTSLNTCLQPQRTTHCYSLQLAVLCTS